MDFPQKQHIFELSAAFSDPFFCCTDFRRRFFRPFSPVSAEMIFVTIFIKSLLPFGCYSCGIPSTPESLYKETAGNSRKSYLSAVESASYCRYFFRTKARIIMQAMDTSATIPAPKAGEPLDALVPMMTKPAINSIRQITETKSQASTAELFIYLFSIALFAPGIHNSSASFLSVT